MTKRINQHRWQKNQKQRPRLAVLAGVVETQNQVVGQAQQGNRIEAEASAGACVGGGAEIVPKLAAKDERVDRIVRERPIFEVPGQGDEGGGGGEDN
ncbi:MAG: hypothetical protein R3D55_19630 [Chloroflexota bacterium]